MKMWYIVNWEFDDQSKLYSGKSYEATPRYLTVTEEGWRGLGCMECSQVMVF
jgi:hypothetical protein